MSESVEEGSVLVDSPAVESGPTGEGGETGTPSEPDVVERPDPDLPLDQIFEILRNQRRRHVLRFLYEAEGSVKLGELSERIAAIENDKEVVEISSSERKRVYVGLYQCHLPKMDGMDVIAFNKPRGVIAPGPNMDLFTEYFEEDNRTEAPWPLYYASASVAGVLLLTAAWVASSVVAAPVTELASSLVVLSFFGLSLFHLWQWREEGETETLGLLLAGE